tara:strand:- start:50 stop:244 length:195 start_codon:yes stop_codon:yes gene_type:complete
MQVIEFSESLQKELDDAKTSNKYVTRLVRARVNELVSDNYMLTVERMRELTALENYLANPILTI